MIYARACQLLPNAAIAASRSPGSRDIDVRPAYPARIYFRPASSRIAASAARPLSVSVYAPLSRLCAMNPRIATACIARAVIPTVAWSMPVAAQNRMPSSGKH